MYINPFFAGILATVCVEIICSFIYALQHNNRNDDMIPIELTPDNIERIIENLRRNKDGEDNDNQGE